MNNKAISEAIKFAVATNDLILVGKLCKLLESPSMASFNNLSSNLYEVSDTLAVQDLNDWVLHAIKARDLALIELGFSERHGKEKGA